MFEICALGGYSEVGRNSTAIKIDDEALVLDLGLHLDNYISYTDDEDVRKVDVNDLVKYDAVPDLSPIESWKDKVKAIIPSHAHLDHIGSIPFIAGDLKAPVICTPFTANVLDAIVKDEKIKLNNEVIRLNVNDSYEISKGIEVEFVNITHSTPQTVIIAIHTRKGTIIYANDFKFDNTPVIGKAPDFDKLRELGKNCIALIVDSLYADTQRKTPSEAVARQMLKDVLLTTGSKNNSVIVTTFSSHIARLKSIIDFGKKMGRKVVFLGRSLHKYSTAAEKANIVDFSKDVEMVKYGSQIKRKLKKLQKRRNKYLFVVTGHQGEPKATLSKMTRSYFDFKQDDIVVFSSSVIPTPLNIENRDKLEKELKNLKVRVLKDVHVSGHASQEDLRYLIRLLRPKNIIPTHGDFEKRSALAEMATDMGYKIGESIHLMENGNKIKI